MQFIYIPCALVFHEFSFTARSVDLMSVEYCKVLFNKHFTGHMVSCYFSYLSQVVWGLNLHVTRTYVQSIKILIFRTELWVTVT